jgi:hypothetical protein
MSFTVRQQHLQASLLCRISKRVIHINRTNLNPVGFTSATSGPSATAGVITSTSTSSRQIQFGLKLLW